MEQPSVDRDSLRRALVDAAPWLLATDVGPRAVEAGACDGCGEAPRLLPTCGPGYPGALCRDCAEAAGDDGWCEGHLDDGRTARSWARDLPAAWHQAVTLWWVSTGEVRLDQHLDQPLRWHPSLRSAVEAASRSEGTDA